jgi:hypothetical protein
MTPGADKFSPLQKDLRIDLNGLLSLKRIGPKSKNATNSTDCTDSKSLADDTFELKRPDPTHD